jgi:hypothetical protein
MQSSSSQQDLEAASDIGGGTFAIMSGDLYDNMGIVGEGTYGYVLPNRRKLISSSFVIGKSIKPNVKRRVSWWH